jgi:hypothetical protein
MRSLMFAVWLVGIVLIASCAGSSTNSSALSPVATEATTAGDLTGTWHGSFSWPGGSYWVDDGYCTMQINKDGTFRATCSPAEAANNLAKPSSWSGVIVTNGNRVTFHTAQGPWVTMVRHGGNVLYGVAKDPLAEVDIMLAFEREGARS